MGEAYQRGLFFFNRRRFSEALREFAQNLVTEPQDAATHSMMAICEMAGGNFVRARLLADEGIRLNPQRSYGHYAMALILYYDIQFISRRGEDIPFFSPVNDVRTLRLQIADRAIKEAIRLDPMQPDCRATEGEIAFARGRWKEALSAAEAGLTIWPKHAACHRLRAELYRDRGDLARASSAAREALEGAPENALSHVVAGRTALNAGYLQHAKAHFLEALRLDPMLRPARHGLLETIHSEFWLHRPVSLLTNQGSAFFRRRWLPILIIGGLIPILIYCALRGGRPVDEAIATTAGIILVLFIAFCVFYGVIQLATSYLLLFRKQVIELMLPNMAIGTRLAAAAATFLVAFTVYMWCDTFESDRIPLKGTAVVGAACVVVVYLLPAVYGYVWRKLRRR